MEIPEREFHKAILAYFEKLHKEVGRLVGQQTTLRQSQKNCEN